MDKCGSRSWDRCPSSGDQFDPGGRRDKGRDEARPSTKNRIFIRVPHDHFKLTTADENAGGPRGRGRDRARPSTKNRILIRVPHDLFKLTTGDKNAGGPRFVGAAVALNSLGASHMLPNAHDKSKAICRGYQSLIFIKAIAPSRKCPGFRELQPRRSPGEEPPGSRCRRHRPNRSRGRVRQPGRSVFV